MTERFKKVMIASVVLIGFAVTLAVVAQQTQQAEEPKEDSGDFSTEGYPEEDLTWANGTSPVNPTRPATGR